MKLRGRTCIVTGATRGLGNTIARRFYEEGASLLLTGRDPDALRTLTECLVPIHSEQKIRPAVSDLLMPAAPSMIISQAVGEFGSVDVLVNNAAVLGPVGPLWENEVDRWENTIRVNLLAPTWLCGLVIPLMKKRGYGKIVNISGGGATSPRPLFSAYATSKAGLVRLTEILAHETKKMNIDVNCVAPGVMRTAMIQEIFDAGPDRVGAVEFDTAQRHVKERPTTLERAAELVLFLASSDSDGISGRLISAVWDSWEGLPQRREALDATDIYTPRRIVPKDRGLDWRMD